MIIIAINRFILIINFRNRFDKALTEIFQFCRALPECVETTFTNIPMLIVNPLKMEPLQLLLDKRKLIHFLLMNFFKYLNILTYLFVKITADLKPSC